MIFNLLRKKETAPRSQGSMSLGEETAVNGVSLDVSVDVLDPLPSPPQASLADRVLARLKVGATVEAIANAEGVSKTFVTVMVDDFERRGLAISANSLCSSGLGACGTGVAEETPLMCAGCPLAVAAPKRKA